MNVTESRQLVNAVQIASITSPIHGLTYTFELRGESTYIRSQYRGEDYPVTIINWDSGSYLITLEDERAHPELCSELEQIGFTPAFVEGII